MSLSWFSERLASGWGRVQAFWSLAPADFQGTHELLRLQCPVFGFSVLARQGLKQTGPEADRAVGRENTERFLLVEAPAGIALHPLAQLRVVGPGCIGPVDSTAAGRARA